MLRGRGTLKACGSVLRGRVGPKIDTIERTYFLNGLLRSSFKYRVFFSREVICRTEFFSGMPPSSGNRFGSVNEQHHDGDTLLTNAYDALNFVDTIVSYEIVQVDSSMLSFQVRIRVFHSRTKVDYVALEGRHNR